MSSSGSGRRRDVVRSHSSGMMMMTLIAILSVIIILEQSFHVSSFTITSSRSIISSHSHWHMDTNLEQRLKFKRRSASSVLFSTLALSISSSLPTGVSSLKRLQHPIMGRTASINTSNTALSAAVVDSVDDEIFSSKDKLFGEFSGKV